MATSGTYTYAPNRAQIRKEALEMVGEDVNNEPTPEVADSADRSLNSLLKALNSLSTDVNVIVRTSINTVAADGEYAADAGTFAIDGNMSITSGSNIYDVKPMTAAQYYGQIDRTAAGLPAYFYFNKQDKIISFYPVPDAIYQIEYGACKDYQDIDDNEQNFDLPASAMEMLTFGLAHRMSIKKGFPMSEKQDLERLFRDAEKRYLAKNSNYTKGQSAPCTNMVI